MPEPRLKYTPLLLAVQLIATPAVSGDFYSYKFYKRQKPPTDERWLEVHKRLDYTTIDLGDYRQKVIKDGYGNRIKCWAMLVSNGVTIGECK